ncbi:hypothetical protein AB7C87_19815 [Natrarchaeobius sp. A-rgal3]|uniref:hypothetical protein n=1 Tax=Natrarchaeobius versutus TaxID=1679078 RepID=UPI003510B825
MTATITGEPGEYWLTVGDERTTVTIDDGAGDGGRAAATLSVRVPAETSDSFAVDVRGGPVGRLE